MILTAPCWARIFVDAPVPHRPRSLRLVVPTMRPRFVSSTQFDALLQRLSPDRDEAGRQYEQLRRRLVSLFTYRGCSDPAELADETLDRVAIKVAAQPPTIDVSDPARFIFGVAWNVARESFHVRRPIPFPDNVEPVDPAARPDEHLIADVRQRCFSICLGQLAQGDRELVLRYFQKEKREKIELRYRLASELRITPNALRVRISRITSSLRTCTVGCVQAVANDSCKGEHRAD